MLCSTPCPSCCGVAGLMAIRSVSSPTTVIYLKYFAVAEKDVSMIKQSASSFAMTYSIPGILPLASFNAK